MIGRENVREIDRTKSGARGKTDASDSICGISLLTVLSTDRRLSGGRTF